MNKRLSGATRYCESVTLPVYSHHDGWVIINAHDLILELFVGLKGEKVSTTERRRALIIPIPVRENIASRAPRTALDLRVGSAAAPRRSFFRFTGTRGRRDPSTLRIGEGMGRFVQVLFLW